VTVRESARQFALPVERNRQLGLDWNIHCHGLREAGRVGYDEHSAAAGSPPAATTRGAPEMSWFSDAVGFVKGVGEGAWDGTKGMVSGVGDLARDGYKFATNDQYRTEAWQGAVQEARAVGNFAETAITDPSKAGHEIGNAASGVWHSVQSAYDQAAAEGQAGEFAGKLFGQGAVLVGTAFIPGGAEADAAGALGDAGRIANLAGDAEKGANIAGDASKVLGAATHAEGEVDLGAVAGDRAAAATRTVRLDDEAAFKAAAEHATPNTTYEFGSYSWTTDAEGRTVQAEGTVELTPAGRDTGLQAAIGKEGESTDVGFHLIGDRFNGPTNRLNVVPGNGKPLTDGLPNLNQGAYKRFENQVAKLASDPNSAVDVRIQVDYNTGNMTTRPDGFTASYRVNGGDWIEREFVNKR